MSVGGSVCECFWVGIQCVNGRQFLMKIRYTHSLSEEIRSYIVSVVAHFHESSTPTAPSRLCYLGSENSGPTAPGFLVTFVLQMASKCRCHVPNTKQQRKGGLTGAGVKETRCFINYFKYESKMLKEKLMYFNVFI